MKLNLGGGQVWKRDEWRNLDLHSKYDIRKKLLSEFEDDSVDVIYTAHFIEHLEYKVVFKLLTDCYRVLKPKGLIRITVPDVDKILELYEFGTIETLREASAYYRARPNVSFKRAVKSMLGFDNNPKGHKSYHSKNSLKLILMLSEFKSENIRFMSFCKSQIEELEEPSVRPTNKSFLGPVTGFDSPARTLATLYIEATK